MENNNLPTLEFVSWKQFHLLCFELAKQLEEEKDFDVLVSISRGGHVISRILSDFLSLDVLNVTIQSYEGINNQKELKISQKLGVNLQGQRILLVDEIVDSGRTLERALSYLRRIKVKDVVSTALHVKPRTSIYPDYFVVETSNWVVYPYEVRETVEGIVPLWKKAGLSYDEMVRKLRKGGFNKMMVEKYLG